MRNIDVIGKIVDAQGTYDEEGNGNGLTFTGDIAASEDPLLKLIYLE